MTTSRVPAPTMTYGRFLSPVRMCQGCETADWSITTVLSAGNRGRHSAPEDGVDERRGLERRQVVRALAKAHKLHGNAEFALHRDHDAALGGPVELRQH